jgi:hypothetical protein
LEGENMTLDIPDARLEYIAYLEEDVDVADHWLIARDILFSFLFAPAGAEMPAAAIPQAA